LLNDTDDEYLDKEVEESLHFDENGNLINLLNKNILDKDK